MTTNTDILVIKNELFISEAFIVQVLPYKVTYFQNNRQKKSLKSWKWIKLSNTYYYDYNTIPQNERLGSKDDLLFDAHYVVDEGLRIFKIRFENWVDQNTSRNSEYYQVDCEIRHNLTKAKELCVAHGVTVTALDFDRTKVYKEYKLTKAEMWEAMREVALEMAPFTFKMKNAISFQNKVKRLPTDPTELRDALINKKRGNQNTRKVGLEDNKIVSNEELAMSKDALWWAAMTYVVAAIGAMATFFYYLSMYLSRRK